MEKKEKSIALCGPDTKAEGLFAIDSDGCVFNSMTVKQGLFHEGIIEFWGLEAEVETARRICRWVGLFSPWRGLNRFQLILKIFRSLKEAIPGCGKPLPIESLEAFVCSGAPLSADELEKWMERSGDDDLQTVLEWSRTMSRRIAGLPPIPVFREAFRGLEALHAAADLIVVSQTTEDALVREWRFAELCGFVNRIAGAESGSKADCLRAAMAGRYSPERTVMVGDAPGDLEAARAAGALFFPIIPGAENDSWVELRTEGLDRLRDGSFAGTYQADLISRFSAVLSETFPDTDGLNKPAASRFR